MRKFAEGASRWYFYYYLHTLNKFETESVITYNYCYIIEKLWPHQICVDCQPKEGEDPAFPTCRISFDDDEANSVDQEFPTCRISFDDEVNPADQEFPTCGVSFDDDDDDQEFTIVKGK